jgi:hypothetical protein
MAVYTDIMSRKTQITLTDRQHRLLLEESLRSSVSMAELVRRAIDTVYRPNLRPVVRGYQLNVSAFRMADAAIIGRISSVPRRVHD